MPNVHIEHLEDLIWEKRGCEKVLDLLKRTTNRLYGHDGTHIDINIKYDGSLSIIMGINPENGRFFVGTKSVFSKKEPKICYTKDDLYKYYSNKLGLCSVLTDALYFGNKLNITTILQGDVMFSNHLAYKNDRLTFQPNVIKYDVTDLDGFVNKEFGVVFHTEYIGNSMQTLQHSFSPYLKNLTPDSRLWISNCSFLSPEGQYISRDETIVLARLVSDDIRKLVGFTLTNLYQEFLDNKPVVSLIKKFENHMVKRGFVVTTPEIWFGELLSYIPKRYKSDKKITEVTKFLIENKGLLLKTFELQILLNEVKLFLIIMLERYKPINTYYGNNECTNEGYVIVDSETEEIVKLVDRLNFSRMNFLNRI